MKNSVFATLSRYGFAVKSADTLAWGMGTLVWGWTAEVRALGNDLYEVTYHEWSYDPDMEPIVDKRESATLHGALALSYLFERLPLFKGAYWRYLQRHVA